MTTLYTACLVYLAFLVFLCLLPKLIIKLKQPKPATKESKHQKTESEAWKIEREKLPTMVGSLNPGRRDATRVNQTYEKRAKRAFTANPIVKAIFGILGLALLAIIVGEIANKPYNNPHRHR